jgi:hypothetical protein
MEDADLAQIHEMCARFRTAIEACDPEVLPIGMQSFPTGACGDAALLLAKFLMQNGWCGFSYVYGIRDSHSHAWLRRGALIVDITSDQFTDNDERSFVSLASPWHEQFEVDRETTADFDKYDSHTRSILGAAYAIISRHLAP